MDKGKVCDKTCKKCKYYQGWFDNTLCCNYFLITGKRRPCDPGKGCTVMEKRKRARRTQQDRIAERRKA